MSTNLRDLIACTKSNNTDGIRRALQNIIADSVQLTDANEIESLLETWHLFPVELVTLSTQALAEIAKNDHNRLILTTKPITDYLVNLLESHTEEESLLIQLCRALCNLCFENDHARDLVGPRGLNRLFKILESSLNTKNERLQTVACGFMLNLIMDKKELQQIVLETNFKVFPELLTSFESCTHVCNILRVVVHHRLEFSRELCSRLVDVLRRASTENNPELALLCLEILYEQSEINDEIKLFLAQREICELIYNLVERHKAHLEDEHDEDIQSALKLACDTIVSVLTGDDAMQLLYDHGRGVTYKNMLAWLDSKQKDLLSTAALAIGNIARNDDNCLHLLHEDKVAQKLLERLSEYTSDDEINVKVQHSLLGGLRNLVVLPRNRTEILQLGLISTLLPLFDKVKNPHVIFALLGTLRMVIDGQRDASNELVRSADFLSRLISFCPPNQDDSFIGVPDEASRLLVWIIKNCKPSLEYYTKITQVNGSVDCLVLMMGNARYPIMQNEALIALNLLATCLLRNSNLKAQLIKIEFGFYALELLRKDNLQRETVENLLSLLERLNDFQDIREHLRCCCLNEKLRNLTDTFAELRGKLQEVANRIDLD